MEKKFFFYHHFCCKNECEKKWEKTEKKFFLDLELQDLSVDSSHLKKDENFNYFPNFCSLTSSEIFWIRICKEVFFLIEHGEIFFIVFTIAYSYMPLKFSSYFTLHAYTSQDRKNSTIRMGVSEKSEGNGTSALTSSGDLQTTIDMDDIRRTSYHWIHNDRKYVIILN